MLSRIQLAGLLLGALMPALAANKGAHSPPPPRPPSAARGPKGAPKLPNPGAVAQRLLQMTPEERERALEKYPPERQAQIRQRLERLDSLPKQQQDRAIERYQQFSSLPPEKQNLVRRQIQAFNKLPDNRRQIVGKEFQRLRRMPESDRQARMNTDEFKSRFTPSEQQILGDLSGNWPPPAR